MSTTGKAHAEISGYRTATITARGNGGQGTTAGLTYELVVFGLATKT
ncbi:hypothetical protein IPL85_02040 [Candidatus Saccharibacteria bacterium]|nr:MAG: hypothetical protein IPL85_02040 [Candidatus Saccharibacteria bacterium]